MKKLSNFFALGSGLAAMAMSLSDASAVIMYDQNVTNNVIFGSGNTNGSFTVDRNNGIELGLRAKLRHNAAGAPENTFNSNGDGTYSFASGVAPTQSAPTGVWSFEWSINSNFDGSNGTDGFLNDFTYALRIDSDPSAGVNFSGSSFDPINGGNPDALGLVVWDHSIGDNSTLQGAGTEANNPFTALIVYPALIGSNNLAQNSWKAHWKVPGFDPTDDGIYDFQLVAFDGTTQVAATQMQVIVGSAVPDGGSMAGLLGISLLGLAGFRRFLAKRA